MSQYFEIHPDNPQKRLIEKAVDIIRAGGVIVYPTDSGYALGCQLEDKDALERICRIRNVDKDHNFTLTCRDLSELAVYARVDNTSFRFVKNNTPGAYTFILKGTKEVPKRLLNPKRKTIGLRVPDNRIAQALLGALDQPLMSTTLILDDRDYAEVDPEQIRAQLENQVDLIIDGGHLTEKPTTVVEMAEGLPEVVRYGQGDPEPFELD